MLVDDPLAGCRYLLDSVNRIAHRVTLHIQAAPDGARGTPIRARAAPARAETTSTMPDGVTLKMEHLGMQTVSGVFAEGRRTTTTHPAGSYLGNDRPVTRVSESWTHPETRIALVTKSTGPDGDSTITMEDFSTAEPVPALFQVPPGYRVVDATGSFSVVLPRGS